MVNAQEYAQRYVAFINEHNVDRAVEFMRVISFFTTRFPPRRWCMGWVA
jgi:hypothetical protein